MEAPPTVEPVSRDEVDAAAGRIAGHVRRTPVLDLEPGAFGLDARLSLKLEYLQRSGSFKARGTFNRMLSTEIPPAGVVAASGGNFALAVALASAELEVPAAIFVPDSSPDAKVERLRAKSARSAEVVVVTGFYDDALAASEERAAETGAAFLHAFDQPEVIAGQGTCGRELSEQRPELDTVVVACGGGGLIGGTAAWYGERVRLVAVESERTASFHAALEAGEPVEVEVGGAVADSLGAARFGRHTFETARRWVDDSLVLTDEAILDARARLWEACRVACEPAAAAPLAALLAGAYAPEPGERVGLIVSGANFDPGDLA